jgi:hypothetical protein
MQLKTDQSKRVPPVCSAAEIQRALDVIGENAVEWAVKMAHDNAVALLEHIPTFGQGASELRMVRIGTESIALKTLSAIAAGSAPSELSAEEQMIIRDFVQRGVPLESILEGLRRSHSFMMSDILAACGNIVPLDQQAQELQWAASVLLKLVNGHSEHSTKTYYLEQRRWQATSRAEVDELVRALLYNDPADLPYDLGRICSRLEYDIEDLWHVGVAAWGFSEDIKSHMDPTMAVESWLKCLNGEAVLTTAQGERLVWGWLSSSSREAAENIVVTLGSDVGFCVAVGNPNHGVRGFRTTHREALRARSVAELSPLATANPVRYQEVRLLALLLNDPGSAADFARNELGALFGSDERLHEIRETVRSYLNSHSPQAVARELFIARNTVGYRLKQAEELLGRSLLEGQNELRAALLIAEHLQFPQM